MGTAPVFCEGEVMQKLLAIQLPLAVWGGVALAVCGTGGGVLGWPTLLPISNYSPSMRAT